MKQDPKIPVNYEAERAVLGAMLIEQANAVKAMALLDESKFHSGNHQVIYRAMQSLSGSGISIDLLAITDELTKNKMLDRAGGTAYIASLMDGIPRVINLEHYARMIKDAARARDVLHFCDKTMEEILAKTPVNEVLESAVQKLLDISSDSGGPLIRKWYDAAQSAVAELKFEKENPDKSSRFNSGLTELDRITSGLRRKDLVVIVGPTSNGKTLIAQEYAVHVAEDGYRGIVFSAEMSGEQLLKRHLAHEAHVEVWKLRKPEYLTNEEMLRLQDCAQYTKPLTIVERDITAANVWAISEVQKRSKGLDFVIVDYDQLVIEAGIDPNDEEGFFRHQRKFNLQAKKLAQRLDICFILLSQLRKVSSASNKRGRPVLDDIYGDSTIRNTPDVIMWVVRDFFSKGMVKNTSDGENDVTVYILKARNDRVGTVKLFFDFTYMHLEDEHPSEKNSVSEKEVAVAKKSSDQSSFKVMED